MHEDYRAVITAAGGLASIPVALPRHAYRSDGAAIAAAVAALGSGWWPDIRVRRVAKFPGEFLAGVCIFGQGVALCLPRVIRPTPLPTVAMIVTGAVVFYVMFRLLGGMDQEDSSASPAWCAFATSC